MNGPELTVGRGVIAELVRLAAFEVPGVARVGRGGAGLAPTSSVVRRCPCGSATTASSSACGSSPGPGQPLGPLTAQVRTTVAATVERLLGLELGAVTVLVDGVGG